ncbi:hypothetical protein TSUD_307320 [Trifolium subterraneum]|nr:hypothetical protein TSUD_307320 [Trifolium subterraneum]
MLDSCDKMGNVGYSTLLFQQLLHPNIFSYNAIIRTYTHNRHYSLAITRFIEMLTHSTTSVFPDKFTFQFVIKSCAGILCQRLGMQVHGLVFKFGTNSQCITENALIGMYMKCGDLKNACKVFDEMGHRDVVSWNSLIFGYVKLGQMKSARKLFDEMPVRTIVSWTTMITGYGRAECYADALDVFREMQMVGIEPDEISIIAVLPACAQLGALEVGKWIHKTDDLMELVKEDADNSSP